MNHLFTAKSDVIDKAFGKKHFTKSRVITCKKSKGIKATRWWIEQVPIILNILDEDKSRCMFTGTIDECAEYNCNCTRTAITQHLKKQNKIKHCRYYLEYANEKYIDSVEIAKEIICKTN